MKRIIFFLFSCFLSISGTSGQDWFDKTEQGLDIEGYIIGIAGDTIQGTIRYDYPIVMQNRLIFTENNSSEKQTQYMPFSIWGYSFNDTYYESTQILMNTYQGTYRFNRFGILLSKPGALAIYRVYLERDKHKKNVTSLEAETDYQKIKRNPPEDDFSTLYLKKLEEPAIWIDSKSFHKKFKEIVGTMISDNKDLKQKVESGEYTIRDIYKIVEEYNTAYYSRHLER